MGSQQLVELRGIGGHGDHSRPARSNRRRTLGLVKLFGLEQSASMSMCCSIASLTMVRRIGAGMASTSTDPPAKFRARVSSSWSA